MKPFNQDVFNFWAAVVYCGVLSLGVFAFLLLWLAQPVMFAAVISLEWFAFNVLQFFERDQG